MVKSHALKHVADWPFSEPSTTYCGKSGLRERHSPSEYITLDGKDACFEVAINGEKATCKRCSRALAMVGENGQ